MTTISAVRFQSPNAYGCPDSTCGQNFADPTTFYKHWTRHKDECPFPTCKTRIHSKYNFERHCARKHGDYLPEFRGVEKTACKHQCGKLYCKADISNLRRHERTCRGDRIRRQPQNPTTRVDLVDGDLTSAINQSSHWVDTPEAVHESVEFSRSGSHHDSLSSSQLALVKTHSLHRAIDPARDAGCWRDSRPVVKAIISLERFLADGPAADALQEFTVFPENLGPSVNIPRLSNLTGPNEPPERFAQSVDSDSVQQRDSERGMVSECEASSHVYPEKYGLERGSNQEFTLEDPYRIAKVAIKVCSAYICIRPSHTNCRRDHRNIHILRKSFFRPPSRPLSL
jgi:hypothetical protein